MISEKTIKGFVAFGAIGVIVGLGLSLLNNSGKSKKNLTADPPKEEDTPSNTPDASAPNISGDSDMQTEFEDDLEATLTEQPMEVPTNEDEQIH